MMSEQTTWVEAAIDKADAYLHSVPYSQLGPAARLLLMSYDKDDHDHDFGDARTAPIGSARMCKVGDCTQWGVRHKGRVRWEDPTPDEQVSLVARMMEDIALAQAMQMIHGRERGLGRVREIRGYTNAG